MRAAPFALACLLLPAAPSRLLAQSLPAPIHDPADAGVSSSGPGQAGPQSTALPSTATPGEGLALPAPQPPPPVPEGLSRVAGRVTIAGLAPRLASVPVGKDMKICGTTKPDEALEIGAAGGIRGAVVWLTGGPQPAGARAKAPARPAKVRLDQTGCEFVPHVLAAVAGSELDIVNSDPVLHNVHARSDEKTVFNYAMPIRGYVIPRKLSTPGLLVVSCDVHPWMHARVHVLPTAAFAVTDARGDFHIDVPPGTYALHLSHERLGQREERVELRAAGATLQHDISLTPR